MQPSLDRWRAAHQTAGSDRANSGSGGIVGGAFAQGPGPGPGTGPGQCPSQVSAVDAADVARQAAHASGRPARPNGNSQTTQSPHDALAAALAQLRGCTEPTAVNVSAIGNRVYLVTLQTLHSALLRVCDKAANPYNDPSQVA